MGLHPRTVTILPCAVAPPQTDFVEMIAGRLRHCDWVLAVIAQAFLLEPRSAGQLSQEKVLVSLSSSSWSNLVREYPG